MSGPQLENGFTRIANELLDAILEADLGKRELKVVFAVMRLTYGWNKKVDDVTVSRVARMTGTDRAHVSRTIDGLVARRILVREPGQRGYLLGINKQYRGWTRAETAHVPKQHTPRAERAHLPVLKEHTPKTVLKTTSKGTPMNGASVEPRKQVWELGIQLLGDRSRTIIGKACKEVGEERVAEILGRMAVSPKVDPVAYFMKACNGSEVEPSMANRHDWVTPS